MQLCQRTWLLSRSLNFSRHEASSSRTLPSGWQAGNQLVALNVYPQNIERLVYMAQALNRAGPNSGLRA